MNALSVHIFSISAESVNATDILACEYSRKIDLNKNIFFQFLKKIMIFFQPCHVDMMRVCRTSF